MKRTILGGLLAVTTLLGGLALTDSSVTATDNDETPLLEEEPVQEGVCTQPPAHIPGGKQTSIEVIAPTGKVIVATCVKAGSIKQGNGPEYETYNPGLDKVDLAHSTGKEISHYTVTLADKPPTKVTATVAYTPPSCTAAAIVILSDGVGYTWSNSGTDLERTYTATATTGYELTGTSVFGPYRLTKLTEGCTPVVDSEPPPAAPPAQFQVASNSPSAPAAAAPAAPVAAASVGVAPAAEVAAPAGGLPATGNSSWVTALIALVTLVGGTALLRVSRRPAD